MVGGSCLCGGVQFQVAEVPLIVLCHCSICRKANGAAFDAGATGPVNDFELTKGEDLIQKYESSPGVGRSFCRVCGSTLVTIFHYSPDELGLAMGTLDDDPGVKPLFHVYVGSKAPWYDITDSLPQFATDEDPSVNAPQE